MESFFQRFPLQINPVSSILLQLALAFTPHLMKIKFAQDKLNMDGKKKDIAGSRQQSAQLCDGSPLGRYISILVGAHNNGLEAMMIHSVAVLTAIVCGVPNKVIAGAAGLFSVTRVFYTVIYLTPALNGILRTLAFIVALVTDVALLHCASQYYAINK